MRQEKNSLFLKQTFSKQPLFTYYSLVHYLYFLLFCIIWYSHYLPITYVYYYLFAEQFLASLIRGNPF
jgi:hypothetical protein